MLICSCRAVPLKLLAICYVLCLGEYAWVSPLKDINGETIIDVFKKIY